MSATPDGLAAAYRDALSGYALAGGETGLRAAYELGRAAVVEGLGVLDLAEVHHAALAFVLSGPPEAGDPRVIAGAAADFFLEALSAHEMRGRALREAEDAAEAERSHARMLRRLSGFLADGAVVLAASDSFAELAQLLAEQALELLDAGGCRVSVAARADDAVTSAVACAEGYGSWAPLLGEGRLPRGAAWLFAPMAALDGRMLGGVHAVRAGAGAFGDVDEAVLVHLAQMGSAAVERVLLHTGGHRGGAPDGVPGAPGG